MAGFSFNFDIGGTPLAPCSAASETQQSVPAKQVEVVLAEESTFPEASVQTLNDLPLPLRRVIVDADSITGTQRDVVRGAYEGGAKTWECTYDLIRWMVAQPAGALPLQRVVDLGCGTGLLGCTALMLGSPSVLLQDLNAPVLRSITAQNIALNTSTSSSSSSSSSGQATLLAGDWSAWLSSLSSPDSAHVGVMTCIVSSETLYDPSLYSVLLDLLHGLLQPGGVALFATKRYYFGAGLGGGSTAFLAAALSHSPPPSSGVTQRPCPWTASIVHTVQDGGSNIRDIVRLEKRSEEGHVAS